MDTFETRPTTLEQIQHRLESSCSLCVRGVDFFGCVYEGRKG